MFRFVTTAIQSTVFLGWMVVTLFTTSVTAGLRAYQTSVQVGAMSAQLVGAAAVHRKQLAAAIARTKAKGRLRRMMVAVPVFGTVLAGGFEVWEYRQWTEEHPEGTAGDYACEVYTSSVEVLDEVLQELPERVRPSPDTVAGWLPECDTSP